jgi:hypothetical protein
MGLSLTDMIEHTSMGFLLRGEFLLYKLANYATVNLIDDAAMLALIFS